MSDPYRGVLFDLFGTLITVDAAALPEMTIDGRAVRSTIPVWAPIVTRVCPGVSQEDVARAFWVVSREVTQAREVTHVEEPARERFARLLRRLGCPPDAVVGTAASVVRVHMQAIAASTRFPDGHRRLLEEVASTRAVAVVTNFDDTAGAYEILGRHGIRPMVRSVVVSEALGLRKPHAALVAIALHDLEVDPQAALMVGDTLAEDVGAAHAVGVDAAWIDQVGAGPPPDGPQPRYVVGCLEDVRDVLESAR